MIKILDETYKPKLKNIKYLNFRKEIYEMLTNTISLSLIIKRNHPLIITYNESL